jgi:hypothetical protein
MQIAALPAGKDYMISRLGKARNAGDRAIALDRNNLFYVNIFLAFLVKH